MRTRALGIVACVAAGAHLAADARGATLLAAVLKPIPVLALGAWVWLGPASGTRYARRIAFALGLSALGDVLIELPAGFLYGLGTFLLAHLVYVAAFVGETRALAPARALPFLAFAAAVLALLLPGLGALLLPVLLYVAALTAMQWRAAACLGRSTRGRAAEWSALLGACLFAASDGLLGVDRFHAPVAQAGIAIMLLYWAAQAGLARSTLPNAAARA